MGRPKTPIERKVVTFNIRLDPPVADAVCKFALEHEISVYRLLGNIITKSFAKRINSTVVLASYSAARVRASSSTGVACQS